MELLDFKMPPFARMVWASKEIKEKWEPRLRIASRTYWKLEHETVARGHRECKTLHIDSREITQTIMSLGQQGLCFVPIQEVAKYNGFAHTHIQPVPGQPFSYYGAVSRNLSSAVDFANASKQFTDDGHPNHERIAELLGYPKCCTDFFLDKWTAGYIDPVWQYSINVQKDNIKNQKEHFIRLKDTIPFETNTILKYIGLRILPHIPCSPDCKHSVKMAKEWVELARELNDNGIEYLLEFLQMPYEWDCLKGISYITTPLFKIETNSMSCYPKHIVQKEGLFYPEEAPKSLKFPWSEAWKFHGVNHSCK